LGSSSSEGKEHVTIRQAAKRGWGQLSRTIRREEEEEEKEEEKEEDVSFFSVPMSICSNKCSYSML
jgi:hypothetical protein